MANITANPPTKVAHHIVDGAHEFPYAVDAQAAVSRHPLEWSWVPWAPEESAAARAKLHEQRTAEAEARGEPPPEPPAEVELTDEERELIAEHRARQAEAARVLAEHEAEEAAKREKQAALDDAKAVLAAAPPKPEPRAAQEARRKAKEEKDKRVAAEKSDKKD